MGAALVPILQAMKLRLKLGNMPRAIHLVMELELELRFA